jgi:hypothetical protein
VGALMAHNPMAPMASYRDSFAAAAAIIIIIIII